VTRRVALALGSNLGARAAYLAAARRRLAARWGRPEAASTIYETEPVGPAGQAPYLNQVVIFATAAPAAEILAAAHEIETQLGRVRDQRWGARTMDIDLLLCGAERHATAQLQVPHPRLTERPFVLVPLAEVYPDWRDPRSGRSVRELLSAAGASGVAPWGPPHAVGAEDARG